MLTAHAHAILMKGHYITIHGATVIVKFQNYFNGPGPGTTKTSFKY